MKKTTKITAVILALITFLSCSLQAFALTPTEMTDSLSAWLPKNITVAEVGKDEIDLYLDWSVFALARSGNNSLKREYSNYIGPAVAANANKFVLADYTRIALSVMSVGLNPKYIGGVNLIKVISSWDVKTEGYTAPIAFALMVLDSRGFSAFSQRKELKKILLDAQRSDGGFNYMLKDDGSGYTSSGEADTTGIVLQALAPYKKEASVAAVIKKALSFIQSQLLADGGYGFWGNSSAESTAQVLAALSALNIDPLSPEYIASSGKNIFDALSGYINPDGGGRGYSGSSNIMTSYQMLFGLNAFERYESGNKSLFDMSDSDGIFNVYFHSFRRAVVIAFSGLFGGF